MISTMRTFLHRAWQSLSHRAPRPVAVAAPVEVSQPAGDARPVEVEFDPRDPLVAYFLNAPGVVEIDRLQLDSPLLAELQAAGVKLTLPLISQGELIGLLNLGPRLSEQEYSTDDYRLLSNLSTQAAPALRVAQLARQQQAEARELERLEGEMRVARFIQKTLLPKQLPDLPGWEVEAFWQPALAVSGDFYDFIPFPDGRLGIVVGDVTDKGVPAALVMASTRSLMRTIAEQLVQPAAVLAQANATLCPDIPEHMFVTCLYAVLDPVSGHLVFANAGHNLPLVVSASGVTELRATGMPLGLMPDSRYSEQEVTLQPGCQMLLYSDGLVEAHNHKREMVGFGRLKEWAARQPHHQPLIPALLKDLAGFTGPGWDQEDDVTLVTFERMEQPVNGLEPVLQSGEADWHSLATIHIPSQPGNERLAMDEVARILQPVGLPADQLERLKTAVAEGTMNAMEHGNHYQPDLPVRITVQASDQAVRVCITDQGGGQTIPPPQTPNLEAKLAGLQSPRGWGLFLIQNMVDELRVSSDQSDHTIELIVHKSETTRTQTGGSHV